MDNSNRIEITTPTTIAFDTERFEINSYKTEDGKFELVLVEKAGA